MADSTPTTGPESAPRGISDTPLFVGLAGVSAAGAVAFSLYLILAHLRNYTEPVYQRFIVRIIFMVPVYATCSFLSLVAPHSSVYFDAFRDIFEAWVVYNFFNLLVAYIGGPGAVLTQLQGTAIKRSWVYGTCLSDVEVDARFIRLCKQGTLQFVWLKLVLASVTVGAEAHGAYCEGKLGDARCAYPYVVVMYNASYAAALYALVMFYVASKDLLVSHKPLLKFTLIKSVIFFTFWQGIAVSALVATGAFSRGNWSEDRQAEEGRALQNFIICLEMSFAAGFMALAFPSSQYAHTQGIQGSLLASLRDAASMADIRSDTNTAFSAVYQDYVCYSADVGGGAARRYRMKTFVPNAGVQEQQTPTPSTLGGGECTPPRTLDASARGADAEDDGWIGGGGSTALEMGDGELAAMSPPLVLPTVSSPKIRPQGRVTADAASGAPKGAAAAGSTSDADEGGVAMRQERQHEGHEGTAPTQGPPKLVAPVLAPPPKREARAPKSAGGGGGGGGDASGAGMDGGGVV